METPWPETGEGGASKVIYLSFTVEWYHNIKCFSQAYILHTLLEFEKYKDKPWSRSATRTNVTSHCKGGPLPYQFLTRYHNSKICKYQ